MAEMTFTPAYSEDDKIKVEKITAWLAEDNNRTGADLSRVTGIKEGTRSSILNGSYISSPTKFLDKMLAVINRETERVTSKTAIPYVHTSVTLAVLSVCKRAHLDKDFGVFIGKVGVGKTTALRKYTESVSGVALVEVYEGMSHKLFLQELLHAAGLRLQNSSSAIHQLISHFKTTDGVILIDEANHLSARSLGALRRISDVAEVGVMLVGTDELFDMVKDDGGRFGQISSRVGYWSPIAEKIELKDAAALIQSYLGEAVSDAALKTFYKCSKGSARTLHKLLRNVWREASTTKADISAELVQSEYTKSFGALGK